MTLTEFIALLVGAVLFGFLWRADVRAKRRHERMQLDRFLDESFRRAKKLDPSSDSHRR